MSIFNENNSYHKSDLFSKRIKQKHIPSSTFLFNVISIVLDFSSVLYVSFFFFLLFHVVVKVPIIRMRQ
jgi:hypothetical protein